MYSDLNIGTEAVDEGSDGIFYLNEMHGRKEGLRLSSYRINIKV